MKTFKSFLLENLNDDEYFNIAMNKLAEKAYEDDMEEYPTAGETFDIHNHKFKDNTEMREEAYTILGDIRKGIKSNLENNKIKVYRGVSLSEMTKRVYESNLNWESWSLDKNVAREFSGWERHYSTRDSRISWLMIGLVELDDIDYELMIDRWINFPEEYEIPVANPMDVEILEIWNLDDYKVYRKVNVDKEKNVIKYK